jgi:1-acyl-sn-glycerol-3-phosphate acyltransferase
VIRLLATIFLRINGWEFEGHRPAARRFVLIAAPHTSNWDLVYLLALGAVVGVKVNWMGKHQLFRGPIGWVMRRVGGVPVRRDRSNDLVSQMAVALERAPAMALTVPPEGTRDYVPFWKSGFYHIAQTARVPIVMGYLDYPRRRGGFGPELIPTGDLHQDMEEIRAFYADKTGRYPDKFGEPRLKEEG